MAKPRCDRHKRSLPYCDACKEAVRVAEESRALKDGVGFPSVTPPEEPADWDKAIDQAEETFREGDTIDETESKMAEGGEFDIAPPVVEIDGDGNIVPMSPEGSAELAVIVKALESDEPVTLLIGENAEEDIRREGRKDVIRMVREYYSDSIDTNAFQLLEYLEKACR